MVAITQLEDRFDPRPELRLVPPSVRRHRPRYTLRRLVVLLLMALLLAAAVLTVEAAVGTFTSAPSATAPNGPDGGATVVVEPGDTLWSIAASTAPDRDPRAVVDELVELNGSADIQIGQLLELP